MTYSCRAPLSPTSTITNTTTTTTTTTSTTYAKLEPSWSPLQGLKVCNGNLH